ncbi:MAG: hypothetical protein IKQ55_10155 [Kiritimatiellae bacterium]|nr:hypothetical protein [Kiritimatiellia bacterium]
MKRSLKERFAVLFVAGVLVCSGSAAGASESSSVGPDDLAASPIARLAQAIEDGDAATVAAYVRYPLEREAPIPAIGNEEEFVAHFPVLFDEPFRQGMREGRFPRDWEEVGCRGVMYARGALWVDGTLADGGKIISVNYQSPGEKRLRAELIEEERSTLAPGLARHCDPVFCFETDDREIAGRVDKEENGDFRILLYDGPARTGRGIPWKSNPAAYFQATAVYEGSGGNHTYLDRFGRYALDVTIVGHPDAPELELYERESWMDAVGEGRPSHYASWFDLLESPDTATSDGSSAK